MYVFNTIRNSDYYITPVIALDRISALRKYINLFKEEFQIGLSNKTSWDIHVANKVLFINIPNSPGFQMAMFYVNQLDNTSFETAAPIDLGEHIDYIKEILTHSYLYNYVFVTETGAFVTGDFRSSAKMSCDEIAKEVFNTEQIYMYYSQCDNQKCGGYICYDDGHAEDFNGIYKETVQKQ